MLPHYVSYLTIPIGLFASFLYVRDALQGKCKPNRISWIFWSIAPMLATYIGYKSGTPLLELLSTFLAGFMCIPVVIVSFFSKHAYWKTSIFDLGCGILCAIALYIWITTQNGTISLLFSILADLFAGIPTIAKSWTNSETESALPYGIGIINQVITLFIIKNFSFLAVAFPLYIMLANATIMIGTKKEYILQLFRSTKSPLDNISHSR